ncbi:MAG: diguanylate cyclase [Ignavibacteriales bacterium]
MAGNQILFSLMLVSTILMLFLLIFISVMRNKKQIHYAFISLAFYASLWNLAIIFQLVLEPNQWYSEFLEELFFFGVIYASISILYLGLVFAKTKIDLTWKHLFIFIIPFISTAILVTNQFHHFFYIQYSLLTRDFIPGNYYMIHTFYSYICIIIGLSYLAYFSIKNSGFFSKQSLLVLLGILAPFITDSFSTFQLVPEWPTYIENIAFTFSVFCFMFAILKFDFLSILPIALQRIVDLISDSYIIINEAFEIVDYNKTFLDTFNKANFIIKRKIKINELFKDDKSDINLEKFKRLVESAVSQRSPVSVEKQILIENGNKYFLVEIIPIFSGRSHIGTILLIKDITEHKKNIEQLTIFNEKLKELANKDGLTQVYNRYFFDERLQQEIERVIKQQKFGEIDEQSSEDFGLIMLDIDFFKTYNDENGHLAGDELLKEIAAVVKSVLFPTDIFCRYGGEEFVIICCKTSPDGLAIAAEKVRSVVEKHEFSFQEKQPNGNLTISVGAAHCPADSLTSKELIMKADERLYKAKHQGRNKVVYKD